MHTPLLRVSSIARSYSSVCKVLENVSFDLFPRQTCLLLGSNGSGKSTLLKVSAGLLQPDSGNVEYFPKEMVIGYASHECLLYAGLTVRENLELFASLVGAAHLLPKELQRWRLDALLEKRVSELSKGEQGRVGLARAFLGTPRVLLLDEPSANLDDASAALLSANIKDFMEQEGKESALLMATHDISRLGSLCGSGMLLQNGVIQEGGQELSSVVEHYRALNR